MKEGPADSRQLIQDLDAPLRSFRLFAIETALHQGSGKELAEALARRKESEKDEECLLLLSHAIAAVLSRTPSPGQPSVSMDSGPTPGSTAATVDAAPSSFPDLFRGTGTQGRLALLSHIPETRCRELATLVLPLIKEESDPVVLGRLLRVFGPSANPEFIPVLSGLLSHPFLSIRMAALEILVRIAPTQLEKGLPRFLLSEEPRIRLLAIQGLCAIDPEEAVLHFDRLLMGTERRVREFALKNAFFLPSDRIKPVLVKFLSAEKDLELVEQAGILLLINPDPEIPFLLTCSSIDSPREKADLLERLSDKAVDALEASGQLGADRKTFQERLSGARQRVAEANRLRDQAFSTILGGGKAGIPSDRDHRAAPETQEQKAPAVSEPPSSAEWASLSPDEQARRLALLTEHDLPKARDLLAGFLYEKSPTPDLTAVFLRTASRLGLAFPSDRAEALLRHPDEKVVSAALEFLGHCDPDRFFPRLGQFLNSGSQIIKLTAIKILKRFDPGEAVSRLGAMLSQRDPAQRRLTMACLMVMDFPLIREHLLGVLRSTSDPELLQMGLWLFQTNPDTGNLYHLFTLEQDLLGSFADQVKEIRVQTGRNLLEMGILTPQALKNIEDSLPKKYSEEQARRRASKPYSVSTLHPADGGEAFLKPWHLAAVIGIGFLLLVNLVTFLGGSGPLPSDETDSNIGSATPGATVAVTEHAIGMVLPEQGTGGAFRIKTEMGEVIQLLTPGPLAKHLKPGARVSVEFVPVRRTRKGVLVAQPRSVVIRKE